MFFTNVSHDLRTPLTLISEPVAQLAEADNLTPQQHTLMRIADRNVRILRRLINQILDFRKYENDKLGLRLVETDMAKNISEWMEAFNATARKRHLRLSLKAPDIGDKPLLMAVDTEKIERVFFNLLSNAFKYTPANGSITVRYGVEDNSFVLSVADTGEGICERDLGNIFDRFYQVDRIHPNGSGIGLSLSKAFVELHGGTIGVESALKKGSVFTVTIPIRHVGVQPVDTDSLITKEEVEAELGVIDSETEIDESKPLVLIIDDNKDIQKLVGQLLNDKYNIVTASDGSEGIRKAARYIPDLIICDVMMPVMDGLECCRRIKAEVVTSHIPVLMLTACSMDEQRIQGYDSGADGYLAKPFDNAVLQARCSSLIANRKRIMDLWGDKGISSAKMPEKPKLTRTATSDIDNDFYNRFLEIFDKEMGNPDMNVDGIAARMGLERSQFYRKIKALTNFSPVELIRTLRLKHARLLLTTTEKSISEIAYETGFSTPAYFTKCYREAYGETPSALRSKTTR